MHPMEKIIILMTACQVLQMIYTLRRVHASHQGIRYVIEMAPLVLCVVALVVLVSRIFNLIPYVGI
jgi:hypothetical protein